MVTFSAEIKEDPFRALRREMVQTQIVARGVKDPRVLAAMQKSVFKIPMEE